MQEAITSPSAITSCHMLMHSVSSCHPPCSHCVLPIIPFFPLPLSEHTQTLPVFWGEQYTLWHYTLWLLAAQSPKGACKGEGDRDDRQWEAEKGDPAAWLHTSLSAVTPPSNDQKPFPKGWQDVWTFHSICIPSAVSGRTKLTSSLQSFLLWRL